MPLAVGCRLQPSGYIDWIRGQKAPLPIAFRGRCPDEKHVGEQTARAVRLRGGRAACPRIARRDAPLADNIGGRYPLRPGISRRHKRVACLRGDGVTEEIYFIDSKFARTDARRLGRSRKVVLEEYVPIGRALGGRNALQRHGKYGLKKSVACRLRDGCYPYARAGGQKPLAAG